MNAIRHFRTIAVTLAFALVGTLAQAQLGTTLTQYSGNQMLFNPGYAGIYDLFSVNLNIRQTWIGIPGSPRLISFNGHAPFNNQKHAAGYIFQREEWGPSVGHFGYANYAHKIYIEGHMISLGLQAGFLNHITDWDKITEVDRPDPVLREGRTNRTRFDANFGAFLLGETYYAGLSVKHLMRPRYDKWEHATNNVTHYSQMRPHFYLMGGNYFRIDQNWAIRPETMLGFVQGLPVNLNIGAQASYQDLYFVGINVGTGQKSIGIILQTKVIENLSIGYSYDIHYGILGGYQRGTHEIAVNYNMKELWGNRNQQRILERLTPDEREARVEAQRLKAEQDAAKADLQRLKDEERAAAKAARKTQRAEKRAQRKERKAQAAPPAPADEE